MTANDRSALEPTGPERAHSLLHGVLVTYRRPREVAETLKRLAEQDRPLDRLVLVDNSSLPENQAAAHTMTDDGIPVDYLPMEQNLGFAGGVAKGMEHVLQTADHRDWVVILDDDDPPMSDDVIGILEGFAVEMLERDPRTAVVGLHGGRFDLRAGRIRRVPDQELRGAVPLDYVGGNGLPFYLVGVLRRVGVFSPDIFFGLSEVEHGLRLRRAGHHVYAHGDLWRVARTRAGRMGITVRPSRSLRELDWRQYYTLRNAIHILRQAGHPGAALRVTLVPGLGKPLANLPRSPALALRHLRLNWRACRDGWTGRLGRTVEPEPWGRRPTKAGVPGAA
jgi:glycosyltransferase involved in cell wall biosynthesis